MDLLGFRGGVWLLRTSFVCDTCYGDDRVYHDLKGVVIVNNITKCVFEAYYYADYLPGVVNNMNIICILVCNAYYVYYWIYQGLEVGCKYHEHHLYARHIM